MCGMALPFRQWLSILFRRLRLACFRWRATRRRDAECGLNRLIGSRVLNATAKKLLLPGIFRCRVSLITREPIGLSWRWRGEAQPQFIRRERGRKGAAFPHSGAAQPQCDESAWLRDLHTLRPVAAIRLYMRAILELLLVAFATHPLASGHRVGHPRSRGATKAPDCATHIRRVLWLPFVSVYVRFLSSFLSLTRPTRWPLATGWATRESA